MTRINRLLAKIVAAAALLAPPCWASTSVAGGVFAVVDGQEISAQEFNAALAGAVRQKFYHRRPPEGQLAQLRQEVADHLINRVLLLREAQRRGLRPDDEKVRAELAAYEKRFGERPQWQAARAEMLQALTEALEENSVVAQVEAATRVAPQPTEAALRAYYDAHPEQFTEPERVRLSMILLKVDPAAPLTAAEQALGKAHDLVKQLAAGADFAELAQRHSGDPSARDGGDLGYRHLGTLPAGVETVIAQLAPGAISEPFRLLEGVAIFRFVDRKVAQLRRMVDVQRNVAQLWAREQGERQWRELIARLRAGAEITITGESSHDAAAGGVTAGSQTAH